MSLSKIDYVGRVQLEGKSPKDVIEDLVAKLNDTLVLMMQLNNEVIGLQQKVRDLESRGSRYG